MLPPTDTDTPKPNPEPKKRGRFRTTVAKVPEKIGEFADNHKVLTGLTIGTAATAGGIALSEPLANGAGAMKDAVVGVFTKSGEVAVEHSAEMATDLVDAVVSSDEAQDAAFNGAAAIFSLIAEAVTS
jgi:hypothetical protein